VIREVEVGKIRIGNALPLTLIAGPCQLESLTHAEAIAGHLRDLCDKAGLGFVFKANRTSLASARGPGIRDGLTILDQVRRSIGCATLTDVHLPEQCQEAAAAVDVLQIPAFLCRQTDLLLAAGQTGAAVNIKKGQFLAPWDMAQVVAKIESTGNHRILLTERGTSFGYNALVSDMRSLPIMAQTGYPVVMDATHAVQIPGGLGSASGGQREFAPVLARAAVSLGIAAVFLETHEAPDRAPSDGLNMIPLAEMARLVDELAAFDALAKARPLSV
jgi:2-dehydro-3-deoxyphosphooctonate aldolase (KDO 8-P synthase)